MKKLLAGLFVCFLCTSAFSASLTSNQLIKSAGGQLTANSIITDNGTNVGVGSTAPSSKLDVNGTLKAGDSSLSSVAVSGDSTFNGSISIGTPSPVIGRIITGGTLTAVNKHGFEDYSVISVSTNDLSSGYSSYDASPNNASAFDINHLHAYQARIRYTGDGDVTNTVYGFESNLTHSGTGQINIASGLTVETPTITGGGQILYNYGIRLENMTGGTLKNYAIYSLGGNSYFKDSVGIGVKDPTAALSVDGTIYALDGNIGIGTASPSSALEIVDGSIYLRDTANASRTITLSRNGSILGSVSTASSRFAISAVNNKDIFISETAGKGILIRDGGNVGIGTTNIPAAALDIGGGSRTYGSTASSLLVKGTIEADGNIYTNGNIETDNMIYIGDPNVNGSWAISGGSTNIIAFQKAAGVWLFKKQIAP